MILVSLGTQDRSFVRLLEAVEKQIKLGNIHERVVVQAGFTSFHSDHMEIFDMIPNEEFHKLLMECDVLITHGGVGTIVDALKAHKKVIAAARLQKYHEHKNNHQKQIIHEFAKRHYLLELDDFDELGEVLLKAKTFEPKAYVSHTNLFANHLSEYISECGKHRECYREGMIYTFFEVGALFFSFLLFFFFTHISIGYQAFFLFTGLVCYRFFMQQIFFKEDRRSYLEEFLFYVMAVCIFFLYGFFPVFHSYFAFLYLHLFIFAVVLFLHFVCQKRNV